MPLFMDVHNIEGGVSASDVAGDAAAAALLAADIERPWPHLLSGA